MQGMWSSLRTGGKGGHGGLRGLVLLNAALLAVLAAVTFGPAADAQQRARGDYSMVAGGAPMADSAVIYIVDSINQEMIAMRYDTQAKTLVGVGYRNLTRDVGEAGRR